MKRHIGYLLVALIAVAISGCVEVETENLETKPTSTTESTENTSTETSAKKTAPEFSAELHAPIQLQADGKSIDIGSLARIGHAGPCVADVDCDGDRDLLVGDFPGFFWFFENTSGDEKPEYVSKGKLQAGGADAKTPVY